MTNVTLTLEEIAKQRAAAKAEFDAFMAYLDAAENLALVRAGKPKVVQVQPNTAPTVLWQLIRTEAAFEYLDTLKDKILLAVLQNASGPTAIVNKLRAVNVVPADYPASHISPKLNSYAADGFIKAVSGGGWEITVAGEDRILSAIKLKKGPGHAA